VHQALVPQGQLDAQHVQVDEIRVKGRGMIAWMGLALMVSTRLWLAGVESVYRDRPLADRLLQQVRACCRPLQTILVCTDGWAAYPGSIKRAFREKVKRTAGRGRACLQVWSELCIATIIKRTEKKRVVEVIRKMTLGTLQQAHALLQASLGGTMLNTAIIPRFNGTMRERLAALTRKCRHAAQRLEALETCMYLVGCTYNLCFPHHELSSSKHVGSACTPVMAAGLTDHVWSVWEVLTYKVAPAPWIEPKRRGRPSLHPLPDPAVPKRPRGRPRKVALSMFTS
jgi:IS1 family transposase